MQQRVAGSERRAAPVVDATAEILQAARAEREALTASEQALAAERHEALVGGDDARIDAIEARLAQVQRRLDRNEARILELERRQLDTAPMPASARAFVEAGHAMAMHLTGTLIGHLAVLEKASPETLTEGYVDAQFAEVLGRLDTLVEQYLARGAPVPWVEGFRFEFLRTAGALLSSASEAATRFPDAVRH